MSAKKKWAEGEKSRIQVVCSKLQRSLLEQAAVASDTDLSTWTLAVSLRAADKQQAEGAPLVIGGQAMDKLRALAARQGISADKLLEQLLVTGA